MCCDTSRPASRKTHIYTFLVAKGKFTPAPGNQDICLAHYNHFPDTAGCPETTNTAGGGGIGSEAQGVPGQLSTMPQVSRPVGQCSYSVKDGACRLVKYVPVGRRGLAESQEWVGLRDR